MPRPLFVAIPILHGFSFLLAVVLTIMGMASDFGATLEICINNVCYYTTQSSPALQTTVHIIANIAIAAGSLFGGIAIFTTEIAIHILAVVLDLIGLFFLGATVSMFSYEFQRNASTGITIPLHTAELSLQVVLAVAVMISLLFEYVYAFYAFEEPPQFAVEEEKPE